jgi:hypothetical protein
MNQRGGQKGAKGESMLYGDSVGIKLPPKTVLIMSLALMGSVIVLHLLDKLRY